MEYSEVIGSRHIILTENGVYEPRYSLHYKGKIDDQLQTYVNQRPVKVMDVACMEGAYNISLSQYSGGDGGRPTFYTSCKLKKLRINTTYEVIHSRNISGLDEEALGRGMKWISPTFGSGDRSGQTYTLDWLVPPAIELYITFEGYFDGALFRPSQSYLHCRVRPDSFVRSEMPDAAKGWFILPTGNVYEDSRLCFGPRLERAPSIIDATKKNIDLFYATPWNSDLLENRDHTSRMFRFNETDNTQLDPLGMPHELMRSFSNNVLERAPIHDKCI